MISTSADIVDGHQYVLCLRIDEKNSSLLFGNVADIDLFVFLVLRGDVSKMKRDGRDQIDGSPSIRCLQE
jgi:hypothetical protein